MKPYGKLYNNDINVSITPLDIYNFYPVGSIYLSVVNINPSIYFGGVWERFGEGKCLVGVDSTQSEFETVLKTGGAKTVTLNTNQMPSHSHGAGKYDGQWMNNAAMSFGAGPQAVIIDNENHGYRIATSNTGGNQAHENMPPYITVYMWKRIS